MRILLVEDDEALIELFKASLTEQRYVVDTATDGLTGWDLAQSMSYDLIVLDVMLPKLDGIQFCRQLRSKGSRVPVMLLTARGTSDDKVLGLDAGADDYVVKPVRQQEFAARVRALLRRGGATVSPILEWGGLQLDPSTCKVGYGSQPLHLTPKEYALLELFLRNNQRVYSRSAILDQLWSFDDELPGEDTVKAHIKGLRQKLKAVGATDLIETVYGLGYRLNPACLKTSVKDSPASNPAVSKEQRQALYREKAAKIWEQGKSNIIQRLEVLEQAARATSTGKLDEDLRQKAQQEAHKLIGTLGTFGVHAGSQVARQIETLLQIEGALELQQVRELEAQVKELQLLVENADLLSAGKQNAPATASISAIARSQQKQQPHLFIIDDDQELANFLVLEANQRGLKTTVASNPQVAKDMIRSTRPDVVLLDLSFADTSEDGLSFLAELSNQTPQLPVLVFTGSNQVTDRVAVARLKGRGFLQKPTTATQVLDTVMQVLQSSQQTQARVVAVDDDPIILRILRGLLEPWGIQVITIDNPLQFWESLESITPDLVIMDIEMPNMSGIELCQTLRNDVRWGWLPVLFLTGSTDAETIHKVFAAGGDDYVGKPIVPPELITRILNRLERTRMLRSQAEVDSLTGLANRQKSMQDLERCLQLARRSQQPFCVAVLELDRLKQVNERYGHSVGEKVLRQVGQLLRREFRSEDVVSRWSGAEFVIGMYGMTRSDGVEWLAEILETLRQMEFGIIDYEPFHMTFSGGVAQYPDDGVGIQELYNIAKLALDRSIAAGGDRVLPANWESSSADSSAQLDIVLVHDDEKFAHSTLSALETRGYHSCWMQQGKVVLEAIAGSSPNVSSQVVLLGGELPDYDRLEVLKRLTKGKNGHSRVILLTDEIEEAEKALKLGAFDYVTSPCSVVVLMQHLRRALES
jgi:diguanylate cyclase (GGDEF)-like protein